MTFREAYKIQHRQNRINARRAAKAANRMNSYRIWARGMSLLREIHRDIQHKLNEIDAASLKMESIRRA